MLTITQLAKKYGTSRATLLYYEREGLLSPKTRSSNGYRWYGKNEQERLKAIMSYRASGISIAQISLLLNREGDPVQFQILKDHLYELDNQINTLKQQQKVIIAFLQQPELLEKNMITKERWVDIMKAAGFDDAAMLSWHRNFEAMEPEEHQKFLESLGIGEEEIKQIRTA